MKKFLITCLAAIALSACGSSGVEQVSSMAARTSMNDSAAVTVTSSVHGSKKMVSALRKAIRAELRKKSVFRKVNNRTGSSDIVVSANLTEVTEPSSGSRAMMGVMAGGKKMKVAVTFKRRRTGTVLGRIIATGKSSDQVAEQIAEYLLKNRKS